MLAQIYNKLKDNLFLSISVVLIIVIIVGLCLSLIFWNKNIELTNKQTINNANTIASAINGNTLSQLHGSKDDLDTLPYLDIKKRLIDLQKIHSSARKIYLLCFKNNQLIYLADSQPFNSPDYSPPGQVLITNDPYFMNTFTKGELHICHIINDKKDPWISVIVPIFDSNHKVFAALAMDYPKKIWLKQASMNTLKSVIIFFSLFVIIGTSLFGYLKHISLQKEVKNNNDLYLALQNSEKKYRTLIENSRDIFFILTKEGIFNYVSPSWEQLLGHKTDDVIGHYLNEFIHTDDYEICTLLGQDVVINGSKPSGIEYRVRHLDGQWFWHTSSIVSLYNEDHEIIGFEGIARDITNYKNAIAQLTKSEANYRNLYEKAPIGIFHSSLDGDLLSANPEMAKILGYSSSDELVSQINNMSYQIYKDHNKRENILAIINQNDGWIEHYESTWIKKDGSYITVDLTERKVLDSYNNVIYLEGFIADITKAKEANIALEESENKYRVLFNDSSDAYLIIQDYKIIDCNKTICELIDLNKNVLLGQFLDCFSPEYQPDGQLSASSAKELINQTILKRKYYCEWLCKKPDNSEFWVEIYLSTMTIQGIPVIFASLRNINDRKIALAELNAERDLFSQGPVFTIIWEPIASWPVRYVSSNIYSILGYTPDEMENSLFKYSEIIHPDDLIQITNEVSSNLSNNINNFEQSYRLKNKSGHYLWFYDMTVIIRDEAGEVTSIRGYLYDQTIQKELEQAIIKERQRLSDIIKATNVGTWEWNIQTGATIFNDRWAELAGYTLKELEPINIDTWIKLIHPDDLIESNKLLHKHFRHELDYFEFECRIKHKNGEWFWVLDRGKVSVWSEEEKPLIMYGSHQDINAKKMIEEALKENAERLSLATRAAGIGIWEYNLINNKLIWDDQMFTMFDLPREQFDGSYNALLSHLYEEDLESCKNEMRLAIQGKKDFSTLYRIIMPDGITIKIIHAMANILRNEAGNPVRMIGINIDITETKRAEEALLIAKDQAESANRAKSEFLANMSHEIRTPLNGVIGFTELLKSTPITPTQKQYLDNAIISANTLLGVINDILDFSKIESGNIELEIIKTNLPEILHNTTDIIKFQVAKKKLELLLNIQPDLPQFAFLDPVRLKQILVNLLSNAVKFTENGEVELKVAFTPINDTLGKFYFEVRDTGIGISIEQQNKLFNAFSQADSSTTRKYGGTGLGLVISKLLAEKMGSTIQLNSIPDKGSTFFFSINTEYEHLTPDLRKADHIKSVLVIDDNKNNRMILEQNFINWGIEFTGCDNGYTAFNILNNSPHFDLIIVDYHMPHLNGLQTIKMIREKLLLSPDKQDIILLHSSSDEYEISDTCKALGIRFNLNKPINADQLFDYLMDLKDNKTDTETNLPDNNSPDSNLLNHDRLTVLIVEDVNINVILIKTIIQQVLPQAQIIIARNGEEAVICFQKHKLDLVLMDIQMPVMDGIEATRIIRNYEKNTDDHLPIIALTAGALKEEKEKCLKVGMDYFLTKPIKNDDLITALKNIFAISQTKTPSEEQLTNQIAHFNIDTLQKKIEYNKEVLNLLLQSSLSINEDIIELDKYFQLSDLIQIKKISHKIKGIALNLSFDILANIATDINKHTENPDYPLSEAILNLKKEWDTLVPILKTSMK